MTTREKLKQFIEAKKREENRICYVRIPENSIKQFLLIATICNFRQYESRVAFIKITSERLDVFGF